MEREIIEQEIELRADTIIPFPKDKYYTKEEVDGLLEEKADEETVDEILIDINSLEDDITDIESNISQLSKITETASQIALNISSSDYKMSATLKDKNGNIIYTSNVIDLPLESVVVSGRYDSQTKKVILTLQNGTEIEFSVADLISGLQEEITINNKLSSDLVDDTNKTNKFVTSAEKTTWNNKAEISNIPTKVSELTNDSGFTNNIGTITEIDIAGEQLSTSGVANIPRATSSEYGVVKLTSSTNSTSTSLSATALAVKNTYDLASGKEDKTNKITTLNSSSTNTQYPSAKAVYDYIDSIVGNINTVLATLTTVGGGN